MIMLTLVAIAEEDGWAFVRTGDGLFVFRPPYQAWNKTKANESMLEQGICRHGFRHADVPFTDWKSLIQYLKQKQVTAWEERGETGISESEIKEMIKEISVDRINEFLDHVEKELLPLTQWFAANRVLITLLDVQSVLETDSLKQRTLFLLKKCHEERQNALDARGNQAAWPFRLTPESYQTLGNTRARSGSAF